MNIIKSITKFFTPTTDSVLKQFTSAIEKLEAIGQVHTDEAEAHNISADISRAAAAQSITEAGRAFIAADKIKKVFA